VHSCLRWQQQPASLCWQLSVMHGDCMPSGSAGTLPAAQTRTCVQRRLGSPAQPLLPTRSSTAAAASGAALCACRSGARSCPRCTGATTRARSSMRPGPTMPPSCSSGARRIFALACKHSARDHMDAE
jgi:hypothetical protein